MIRSLILSLLIGLILAATVCTAHGDYLTFRGDAQRTGNVSGTGPGNPDILWSEKVTSKGYVGGGASICEGRAFVSSWPDMSYKGEQGIACLNAEDGSLIWLNPIGGKGGASTPAVYDGLVFAGSWKGDLYCLDAASGDTIWNRTLESDPQWWGLASSPLVIEDMIFVTSYSDGALHVLDYEGNELWNLSTGKIDPYTSPAGDDGKAYFAGGDPALYCVNISSFDLIWKHSTDAPITSTPAVWNGKAYFATRENLYAVDAGSGEGLWRKSLKGTISSPALSCDRVYIGTGDDSLDCYNASDGSLIWRAEVESSVKSSPLVVGDMVYFGTHNGLVYALDASDGREIWTYDTGAYMMSSPSFSEGLLFIGSDDGCLYAFGVKPSEVIFEGEVLLEDGSFNLTAESGVAYSIDERSALGALIKASETGGFDLSVDDSIWDDYGLFVRSIDGIEAGVGEIWMYWVNYPDEPMPLGGSDRFFLEEGDVVTFYIGDRGKGPYDSHKIVITTRWG
ncbi:MAG: PQQ-binding-like beta-propeller repeat protein [Methanotrichaceae archaeon]|nr:PQQ-binding-like beta-propeller repeat protein [Methanotrichaceae archaeon]